MTQKPKLSVGDKVRVYAETGLFDGTVEYIFADRAPSIRVRHDDGVRQLTRDVFSQQCRKLRPKQKPEKERADSAAVGSIAGFAFSMDPSIPPNEVHMRHNGKTVAVFTCGELPGKDKA